MLVFLFAYVFFGYFVIRLLKLEKTLNTGERVILSPVIGISILTSLIAVFGEFISVSAYNLVFLASGLGLYTAKYFLTDVKEYLKVVLTQKKVVFLYLLLLCTFCSTIIFSYLLPSGKLQLQEVHDSVWHVALIENLQNSIPPLHPSTDQLVLNNYHYFYDVFLASIINFSIFNPFTAYFQFSVVLLSTLLLLTTYVLGRHLHTHFTGILLSVFTVITGSFAYFIPLFLPSQIWHESSFWVSQTLVMIVNPQIIYTLALAAVQLLLLILIRKQKKVQSQYLALNILFILLTATSIGFKSYAWVIFSFVYAFHLLSEIVTKKSIVPVFLGFAYMLVSAPFVWIITGFQSGSFFYEPLWYTNTMVESPDRLNYLEWKFLQDHFIATNNWIRLTILETKKLIVFYIGNLGIRALFLLSPILLIFNTNFRKKYGYVFYLLVVGFLFSTVFPLLFLQSGTVWNSIQFFYYGLLFANVGMVLMLAHLLRGFKGKSKNTIYVFIVFLVVLAVPTSIKTIYDKVVDPFILQKEETAFLSSLSKSDKISLCSDGSVFYKTSLVKAVTPASVYFANPSQIALVGSDQSLEAGYEELYKQKNIADLKQFYRTNNITHVVCTDISLAEELSKKLMIELETHGELFTLKLSK